MTFRRMTFRRKKFRGCAGQGAPLPLSLSNRGGGLRQAHRPVLSTLPSIRGMRGSTKPMPSTDKTIPQRFYHGTRADLKAGDLIAAGYSSNYGARKQASWVYLSGTLDAAI